MDIEVTQLPCGLGCGTTYALPTLVEPEEIQREALSAGWGIRQINGRPTLVCTGCAGQERWYCVGCGRYFDDSEWDGRTATILCAKCRAKDPSGEKVRP